MSSPRRQPAPLRSVKFTALQGQYLAFIRAYENIHGCAPAEADLQQHFGVTPPSVHQMILTLERKGLISRTAGVARSITLRVAPAELPPLERSQQQSQAERQRAGLAAAKSRQRVDGARRKSPLSSSSTRVAANDRAAEYVDSPMMTQRLRFGRSASARIAGRYGDYRTKVRVIGKQEDTCTCPSDSLPCKHARALRATWRTNPRSFFDVDAFIRSIASMEKADLIGTISEIVIAFPQTLGLFGVAGFDEDGDEDDVVDEPMD